MAGFFDKVVVGLNRGVNSVSEGSKILIEKAKLNTQIQDTEKEKNGLIMNMGNLVYNLQMSGAIQLEQCSAICEEISKLNSHIAAMQEQIKALETPKQQYYTPANEQYQPQPPITNGVTCECGFINKETAKFCAKCGHPLSVEVPND